MIGPIGWSGVFQDRCRVNHLYATSQTGRSGSLCAPLGVLKERAFGIEKGGVGSKGGGLEEQWSDAKGSKRTAEPPVNSVGLEVTASRTD